MTTLDRAALADVVGGLYKPPVRVGPQTTIYNPFGPRLPGQPPLINRPPLPRPTPF